MVLTLRGLNIKALVTGGVISGGKIPVTLNQSRRCLTVGCLLIPVIVYQKGVTGMMEVVTRYRNQNRNHVAVTAHRTGACLLVVTGGMVLVTLTLNL